MMFIILLTVISIIYHHASPKTIDDFPERQKDITRCKNCFRIYVPICASDNQTYTNECWFRCVQRRQKNVEKRARILRMGPCILGQRKKRSATFTNNFVPEHFD